MKLVSTNNPDVFCITETLPEKRFIENSRMRDSNRWL